MKRVVQNDLAQTDFLLGKDASVLASRTAPYASPGVSVSVFDPPNQLIIEDFGSLDMNNLGLMSQRSNCNNRTLPALWDVVLGGRVAPVIHSASWQWIHMNISRGGPSASWNTTLGSIASYSDYNRLCIDIMISQEGIAARGSRFRFPDNVLFALKFTLADGTVTSLASGQDFTMPILQVNVLYPMCFSLNSFGKPINVVDLEAHVPSSSGVAYARIFMDRVRLERYADPVATAPTSESTPQGAPTANSNGNDAPSAAQTQAPGKVSVPVVAEEMLPPNGAGVLVPGLFSLCLGLMIFLLIA